jgi:NAD(P)-dependent dehydrogenase (short-subunit alcohol dehydrogenase family)
VLDRFPANWWAVILGGSSGFGLATAHRLAARGMNLCLVHRDRRGAMTRIEPEFEKLRASGVQLLTENADALDPATREAILDRLGAGLGANGRVRVLLHSIAFGNLKLLAPEVPATSRAVSALAAELALDAERMTRVASDLFAAGVDELASLAAPARYGAQLLEDEDFTRTIHAMGTSLLGWTQSMLARGFFASDARVFGLTSEGNTVAWKGYAAVSAAKAALEALARSMAVELAPHGIRTNVIQPGVTDTPALRAIPGHERLRAGARMRNPFRRLTTPEDVADVIALLARDEAAWINGTVIRVDGGEHVAGGAG